MTVTAGGKQYKASHVINTTQPGSKVNVEIPVSGRPARAWPSKIEVERRGGARARTTLENNKATYLAIFAQ